MTRSYTRRSAITMAAATASLPMLARGQTPVISPVASPVTVRPSLTIDLSGEPDHLTPALTYSTRDWSVLHSIYDSLLDFGPDGDLVPQAAETFTTDDETTFHVRLRAGMSFHDGTPVTSAAITRSVQHLKEAESQISELFAVIDDVREIDDLTAEIVCREPSAWLPSQIVVWLVLLPEGATSASLASAPVGSGPYVFGEWVKGDHITLHRNPNYPARLPKGDQLAETVTYRFVPEAATRVADLASGAAQIIAEVPADQIDPIESNGHRAVTAPVLGTAFIRVANTVAPFDDPRIAQALNLAVDVETIATQLVSRDARRLASVFPDPRGLGFDPELAPFAYDPDQARALLNEAGQGAGFETEIEVVSGSRTDVLEAITAQWQEIGVNATIVSSDLAAFNQAWPDGSAPPLRYATWRPMYDPFTFLRLVMLSKGYLSRYDNPAADDLITRAAQATTTDERVRLYHELGRELQSNPAAIYLWNLVSTVGLASELTDWSPRGDEYVLPLGGRA